MAAAGDVNGDGLADFAFANSDNVGFVVFGRRDLPDDAERRPSGGQGGSPRTFTGSAGGHNITDAIATLNHLFLGAEPLPAPYPAEGEDPTADGLGCLGY